MQEYPLFWSTMNGGFRLEEVGMMKFEDSVLTTRWLGGNVERMNGLGSQVLDSR